MIEWPQQWRTLMRFYFFVIFIMISSVNASAQGLPANPWANHPHNNEQQAVINENISYNQAENKNAEDIAQLKASVVELQNKMMQNNNNNTTDTQNNSQINQDNKVSSVEALKAFNTLSKYVQQGNNNNSNQHTETGGMDTLANAKKQLQKIMDNGSQSNFNNYQNSKVSAQINQMERKYKYYKNQVTSGYHDIKNKTAPIVNSMKKSIDEAEKVTGVNF